jgi:RNA polymerase sigma factor (sigma-70 family)
MSEPRLSALTSLALLNRARQGERAALDELFARYVPFLRRLARGRIPRWMRSGIDTADLVQDTLLHAFRRVNQFEPRGNGAMRAYLRQALHNRIQNVRRDAMRRPVAASLDDVEDLVDSSSPLEELLSADERAGYLSALDALRPEDRAAIVGRFELGYSFEQLSAALGKPSADAARMAVRRAIVRLAEAMTR